MFFFINLRKQFRCTATSNLFNPTKQPLQLQPEALFIIRAMPFCSIIALTALKRSSTDKHPQRYLFVHRRKIKGQKQDLSSHSRPSYFIIAPKRVLFRYAFLFFSHANAPLKQSESNKTPISFSSKYIDQSFYIYASPPCLCVVPFSNRYTSQQEPHRF